MTKLFEQCYSHLLCFPCFSIIAEWLSQQWGIFFLYKFPTFSGFLVGSHNWLTHNIFHVYKSLSWHFLMEFKCSDFIFPVTFLLRDKGPNVSSCNWIMLRDKVCVVQAFDWQPIAPGVIVHERKIPQFLISLDLNVL